MERLDPEAVQRFLEAEEAKERDGRARLGEMLRRRIEEARASQEFTVADPRDGLGAGGERREP